MLAPMTRLYNGLWLKSWQNKKSQIFVGMLQKYLPLKYLNQLPVAKKTVSLGASQQMFRSSRFGGALDHQRLWSVIFCLSTIVYRNFCTLFVPLEDWRF